MNSMGTAFRVCYGRNIIRALAGSESVGRGGAAEEVAGAIIEQIEDADLTLGQLAELNRAYIRRYAANQPSPRKRKVAIGRYS